MGAIAEFLSQPLGSLLGWFAGGVGLGAIVDWCLGTNGRRRIRRKLGGWLISLRDVNLHNFARCETGAALAILDRWVGARLWSRRRWIASLTIFFVAWLLSLALATYFDTGIWEPALYFTIIISVDTPFQIIVIAITLSLTRLIAQLAHDHSNGLLRSAMTVLLLICAHFFLLFYGTLLEEILKSLLLTKLLSPSFPDFGHDSIFTNIYDWWTMSQALGIWPPPLLGSNGLDYLYWTKWIPAIALNGGRLGFLAIFAVAVACRPCVRRFVSVVMPRMIRSRFGLLAPVCGALAAAARGILELVR